MAERVNELKTKRNRIIPLMFAALFSVASATSIVATQATHPAKPGSSDGLLSGSAQPASAQGYGYRRPGHYHWRGRYWAHRRWHRGYWAGHRWHPGVWIYF
jgi:hypothetical protein